MSCFGPSSHTQRCIAMLIGRITLGLCLILVGIVHYTEFGAFMAMTSQKLGPLTFLGTFWAYILPGLMILGGLLLVSHLYMDIAAWLVSIALGSIAAGMLLKSVIGGETLAGTMPAAVSALIWFLFFLACASGERGKRCVCDAKA